MILDKLENLGNYELGEKFHLAEEFLRNNDLMNLPPCKIKVSGNDVVVNIIDFTGKKEADCRMEAHRDFCDIQIIMNDEEEMGWKPQEDCKEIITAYNEEKDVEFYADKADAKIKVGPRQFAIFFPSDAHQPGIAPGRQYRKIIVKVRETF